MSGWFKKKIFNLQTRVKEAPLINQAFVTKPSRTCHRISLKQPLH